MKILVFLLFMISSVCFADTRTDQAALLIGDANGTNAGRYRSLKFTNGATTNNGDGSVSVTISSGGTPGGSPTQLQYNSSGSFAGVLGSGVDSSGNVGINSASPGQTLDVTGTGRFSVGLLSPSLLSRSGVSTFGGTNGTNNEQFTINAESIADVLLVQPTTGATLFWQDFAVKYNMTTSFPVAKSAGLVITDAVSNTDFPWNAPANQVDGMQIQNDSGTTTDYLNLLHINMGSAKRATGIAVGPHGDGQNGIVIETSASSSTSGIPTGLLLMDKANTGTARQILYTLNGSNKFILDHSGNVGIGTGIASDSLIVASGNVGIGSKSPGWNLDVQGTVRFNISNLSTTQTAGLYLNNNTTGSIQVAPSISFNGNIFTAATSFPTEFRVGVTNGDTIGGTWVLRALVPSVAIDNTLISCEYSGGCSIPGLTSTTITTTSNVGIGTTSTIKNLVVGGSVFLDRTSSALFFRESDGTCASCGPNTTEVWTCSSVACP